MSISTMSEYCLDTNAVIAILNGDTAIAGLLDQIRSAYIPVIVIGELYFGAQKSAHRETNLARIREFVSARRILIPDEDTAFRYGEITQELQSRGRVINHNDLWIAAISSQHNLILVTRDKHFHDTNITGLQLIRW